VTQPPLNFDTPTSRRSDHATSAEAAAHQNKGSRQADAAELLCVIRQHPQCTLRELANLSRLDAAAVSKRLSDLSKAGAIYPSGTSVCSISKRNARAWRVTEP